MKVPSVSVVVPCRNEEKTIGKCLDSLIACSYPKDRVEVLIIDGMSEDRTREILEAYAKRFTFIKILDNPMRVQPAALNIGILHAQGDIIIRMDAHSSCMKNFITKSVESLMETGADCVGGCGLTQSRDNTFIGKAIALVMSHTFGVGISHFRVAHRPELGRPREVEVVPNACYRRRVFDRIGLFNERLSYSDDIDLFRRMRKAGCRILFVPSIVSIYYARSDFKAFWNHTIRNGIWAVLPTKYTKRIVVSPRHLVPFAFVGSLAVLGILSLFIPLFLFFFLLVVGSYSVLAVGASIMLSIRERDIRYLGILPMVFIAFHLGYGIGSWIGFTRVLSSSPSWVLRSEEKT